MDVLTAELDQKQMGGEKNPYSSSPVHSLIINEDSILKRKSSVIPDCHIEFQFSSSVSKANKINTVVRGIHGENVVKNIIFEFVFNPHYLLLWHSWKNQR